MFERQINVNITIGISPELAAILQAFLKLDELAAATIALKTKTDELKAALTT